MGVSIDLVRRQSSFDFREIEEDVQCSADNRDFSTWFAIITDSPDDAWMLKNCQSILALVLISFLPEWAEANPRPVPVETIEVVGTHSGLPLAQLSGQISVIDRDEIDALNKDSVQQLLQSLAGVSINQQGGAGGVSSLYVRGGEANFAVVMIDGIQVNNPRRRQLLPVDWQSHGGLIVYRRESRLHTAFLQHPGPEPQWLLLFFACPPAAPAPVSH